MFAHAQMTGNERQNLTLGVSLCLYPYILCNYSESRPPNIIYVHARRALDRGRD